MRSIKDTVRSLTSVIIVTAGILGNICTASVSADIEQPPLRVPPLENVHSASYCVYDKTADEIIISVEPDKKIFPASQTKIMTCQLALDYLDLADYLTVSTNAMRDITSDSSVMGIQEGEVVQVSELLYGLMLPSGNDAANVLAEGVVDAMFEKYPANGTEKGPDGVNASYLVEQLGKSEQDIKDKYKLTAFASLMNLRAKNLGCKNTHFVNAHGLHDDEHYTSASDLTLIIGKAYEKKDFKILISTTSHIFKATNRHSNDAWSYVKNTDYLLFDPWLAAQTGEGIDSHLIAIIGGKTGTTSKAGKGLTLATVNENGHELMVSICGIPADYQYFTTMYAASVTAYGHLACWKKDSVTKYPGTTGDYRYVNAPAAQQPAHDSLIFPGDKLSEEEIEAMEPTPTPAPVATLTPIPSPVENKPHPIRIFVKEQPVVTGVCLAIFVAIVAINVALIVRVRKLKRAANGRGKGKIRKPTGII